MANVTIHLVSLPMVIAMTDLFNPSGSGAPWSPDRPNGTLDGSWAGAFRAGWEESRGMGIVREAAGDLGRQMPKCEQKMSHLLART